MKRKEYPKSEIDAETGDGLLSNPFYDVNNPRSAQSRTYSLGFRNPFRIK